MAPLVPFLASFPQRSTLTRRDRIVLRAVAEAMFSQDGEVDGPRIDAHLDEVDSYISAASKPVRFGLRVALFIVRIAPLLLFFRMRTIDGLPIDERVDLLARLERSRITNLSLAFIGWRTVMTMIFYEDPAELRSLGYTSERKVHKRRLLTLALPSPLAPLAPPPPPLAPLAPPLLPAVAPPAEESGVRLRNPDSDHPSTVEADEAAENKVA